MDKWKHDDNPYSEKWTLTAGRFDLCVYKFKDSKQPFYTWCVPIFGDVKLKGRTLEEAKCQAKAMLQVELESALTELLEDSGHG